MVQFMKLYDVFISYRRSDGLTIAEALYKYLTSKGLRVFLDRHKMIDGHYFTTQIETNLRIAPNYILVATNDVFKFRKKEDWVRKEIEGAIEEYEANPIERTLTVLVPESVNFPEKEILPESTRNIADAQRIALPYGEEFAEPFYKVLKAVTSINRRNLWFAAHRWLENSKQPGGRFANLNINESILPNASDDKKGQKIMPINVYGKDESDSKNCQSLLEAVQCRNNHLYLIGQGGIGKTTALMHIMNNAYVDKQYSETAQIPLFVELSFAPDTYGVLYENGKSSFIRRSIYKQVRADRTIKQVTAKEVSDIDEVFSTLPYDVAVQPITDILSKTTPAPEYLLLLDGLNEVSSITIEETGLSVVQMIMREIDLLISECPNVRVILTSRSDEATIYNESILRLYLSGIENGTIEEYLKKSELPQELIDKALEDENLCETLQIPLFLTMYTSLSKYDEASMQGEILKLFFNERRKNIVVYTMQERFAQVEKNVTDVASAVQKNRIDADMQNFILDFILPEIAWHMERNNDFYLRVREIKRIIEPILNDTDDLSVCGEFGREVFSKYRNGASAKMHTYKVAKRILERLGDDITEVTESIVNCCVFALGVLQESNGKYGFVHQHIRDYFAALKNINTIRLSVYLYEEDEKKLALECMNRVFKDEPVNYTVRRFMGEYLGEHRNRPYHANGKWNYGVPEEECDRNLIDRTFNVFRGYCNDEIGYGIHMLFSVLKVNRYDLSGCNFSDLDFKNVFLGNAIFGRNDLPALFKKSIVDERNLIPTEVKNSSNIIINSTGTQLIFVSVDLVLKIINIETLSLIKELDLKTMLGYTYNCKTLLLYDDKHVIVIPSVYGSTELPALINIDKETVISRIGSEEECYNCGAITPDKKYLLLCANGCIEVWNLNSSLLQQKIVAHNKTITSIDINPSVMLIATASTDKLVKIWEYPSFLKRGELSGHTCSINSVSFSQDGKKIVTAAAATDMGKSGFDATIRIWNVLDFCEINRIQESWHVEKAIFDSTGQYIFSFNGATTDCNVKIHEAETGKLLQQLSTGETRSICEHLSKKLIITAGEAMNFWDARTFELIDQRRNKKPYLKGITFDELSEKILVILDGLSVHILDRDTLRTVGALYPNSDTVTSAKFCENGKYILTTSKDKKVEIWSNESYNLLYTANGFLGFVKDAEILNGRIFALTTYKNSCIEIYTLDSMKINANIPVEEQINWIIVNSKYNEIYAISNHSLYVWNAESYELKDSIYLNGDELICVSKSDNENYIVMGCQHGSVFVLDVKAKSIFRKFYKRNATITAVTFCSDDRYILCYEYGLGYRVWDVANNCLKATIAKHYRERYATGIVPINNKYAVATTDSGLIYCFDFLNCLCVDERELLNGVDLINVNFRDLYPTSQFGEKGKLILYQHGAII